MSVTLAQALLKSDKMDRVIRDAVMLGVAAVQPFVRPRTDVPMKAVEKGGRQDHGMRIVIASVKQCGRAVVPPVHEVKEFQQVLRETQARERLLFVEPGAGSHSKDITSLEGQQTSDVIVFVGPEGRLGPAGTCGRGKCRRNAAVARRSSSARRRSRRRGVSGAAIRVARFVGRLQAARQG